MRQDLTRRFTLDGVRAQPVALLLLTQTGGARVNVAVDLRGPVVRERQSDDRKRDVVMINNLLLSDELCALGLTRSASRPIQDIASCVMPVLWHQVMS